LAELIERDVAVVAEVLRIANTIGFNPEGVEITTIAQAIQVIGFIKIRNLAVSLLLLQNSGVSVNSPDAREASALAVACGYLAEVGLERLGTGDPGHAFVCAALRRYGHLLVNHFLAADYVQVQGLARTGSEDAAFCQVLGLTPMELGRRVLEAMRLPASILDTFRELPGQEEQGRLGAEQVHLLLASDCAAQITSWLAANRGAVTLDSLAGMLRDRYGSALAMKSADLKTMLVEIDRRLSLLRGALGSLPVMERVRALAASGGVRGAGGSGAGALAGAGPDPSRILMDGIAEVSELLGGPAARGPKLFQAAARSLEAALGLVDCWVFRRPPAEALFRPFLGTGVFFPQLPVRSAIDPAVRTVFTVCVQRGEIVLLPRPSDPKLSPFIPDWLIRVTGEAPLVLLPVGGAGQVSAVLCGVGEPGGLRELSPAVRQQLQVMGRLLALARDL
jgi:hypothetical protein